MSSAHPSVESLSPQFVRARLCVVIQSGTKSLQDGKHYRVTLRFPLSHVLILNWVMWPRWPFCRQGLGREVRSALVRLQNKCRDA